MMSVPTPMGSPGRDPAQLQLARDMVLPACQAFGAALARFDDALFDRAGNAGSSQLLFLDAMRELRRRREDRCRLRRPPAAGVGRIGGR